MRISGRLACYTGLLIGLASTAAAQQTVRGSVLDSATDAPIAGAIVTILGTGDASLGRTVTGSRGEFFVPIAGAAVRARVLRIGFRPRDVEFGSSLAADGSLKVRMARLPSLLEAVRVTDRELCPSSAQRGGAFTLWEQVRAALLATIVARESNPAVATTITYQRREDPSDHLVQRQEMAIRSGSTTRPFVAAASAMKFALAGYVATDTSGQTLYAPDADVLVDEAFATTHCFHLEDADKLHAGQIGLAFSPAPRREKTVDVEGVIWVDATRPALRSLDFRHTGFDNAWSRNPPGGHIEFQDAPNGVSFICRWFIDIPVVRVIPGASGTFSPGRVTPSKPDEIVVDAVQLSGGSVVSAKWRDGSSWAEDPTGVSGVLVEQGTNTPIADVLVSLDGTADTVTTDSLGRFSFSPMVPGKYRLQFADTALEAFARSRRDSRVIDIAAGKTTDVRETFAPIGETIGRVCKNMGSVFRSVLVGQMVGPDSTAIATGQVRAAWRMRLTQGGVSKPTVTFDGSSTSFDLTRDDQVDSHGRFVLCGLPNDVEVRLQWNSGAAHADTVVGLNRKPVARLEWRVPSSATSTPAHNLTITGSVTADSAGGRRVENAEVMAPALGMSVRTNASGVFRLAGLSPGRQLLFVRRIGYQTMIDSITVGSSAGESRHNFVLKAYAVELDSMTTLAKQPREYISPSLNGFLERMRAHAGGYFVDDSTLRRNESHRLPEVLSSRLSGMKIFRWTGDAAFMVSTRTGNSGGPSRPNQPPSQCYSTVYLDGVLVYDRDLMRSPDVRPPDLSTFLVSDLAGVEFYPGDASLPVQFRSSACGTLLLWTREK